MRGMVNGSPGRTFLGMCGAAVTWDDDGNETGRDEPCEGAVYGRPGADEGRCQRCQARWPAAERRKQLAADAREQAYQAKHIEDAYGIPKSTIHSWDARGKLQAYWRTEARLTVAWTPCEPDEARQRGPKLFYLGDVQDLAAQDAVRRHERQQKRDAALVTPVNGD